jgi:pyridoxal phosphate-dependent aminotransferase EpsN
VIVSSFTFAATANAIRYVNATPVFVDSDEQTWNMDPDLLEEELRDCANRGRLPKAVIVVDLYGQCADYDRIVPICEQYGVPIIEDAAEALGARYKGRTAGSFGVMSTLSFNGNKIITTSGGGALLSRDPKFVERARFLATQARVAAPHYQHSSIGYNYRLSNLLAAVGRGQLALLHDRVTKRRANFARYNTMLGELPGIEFMPEPEGFESTRWLTCMTVDPHAFGATREEIRLTLEASDIESRPTWKPMHLQPVFAGCRVRGGAVSENIFEHGLCLPSGSSLTTEQQDRVIELTRSRSKHPDLSQTP